MKLSRFENLSNFGKDFRSHLILDKVKYDRFEYEDLNILYLKVTPSGKVFYQKDGKTAQCFVIQKEAALPSIKVSFKTKPDTKVFRLHILLASTFLGYKKGDIIIFKDGDVNNYNIENLIVFKKETFRDLTIEWLKKTYQEYHFLPVNDEEVNDFDYIRINEGHVFSCNLMDIISISNTVYKSLNLVSKDKKHILRKLHRLIASTFIRKPEPGEEVDHIDRNPSNNNASNLRFLPEKENRYRTSTIEEQTELGHIPTPLFGKMPIVKYLCELEDSAWTLIGEIGGYTCSGRELSIMGNIRKKDNKDILFGCGKIVIFNTHRSMSKIFRLYFDDNPIKGVSRDPRKDQNPTASLYLTDPGVEPPHDEQIVVDHIDGVKTNNSVMNLRKVIHVMNTIASIAKPCILIYPHTNERVDYRAKSQASEAVGYDFSLKDKPCQYITGPKGKGMHWEGAFREKLWFSFKDENGVVHNPRERYSNPTGKKATPVLVEDPYTGEKRKYERLCDAEKSLEGKRIKFRSKKGDTTTKKEVMWLGRRRKEVHIKKVD
ncbi:hypothetical protein K501DRAFT_276136 [Backusella circina FSU 941]|nr:hypothetical protein K501DRAFT_276136 [Backusella circina FSU 941]